MSTILLLMYFWSIQSGLVLKDGEELLQEQRVMAHEPVPFAAITFEKAKAFCRVAQREAQTRNMHVTIECQYYEVVTQAATPTERARTYIRHIGHEGGAP